MNNKFTEERRKAVLDALEQGASYSTAAACAGVDRRTLYNWTKRGEREPDTEHGAFAVTVRQAEARFALAAHATLQRAMNEGDWRAAAWWLERRYPEDYGHRQAVRVEANVEASARVDVEDTRRILANLSDDALEELSAAVEGSQLSH